MDQIAPNSNQPLIMVVEDEPLLLEAITKKLTISGFSNISSTSGRDAYQKLLTAPRIPDAIWLDYHLQDTNGIEFMQQLKQTPKLANTPVVVVSNSADKDNVLTMLALGVDKYLLKSENRLEDIIDHLHTLIANKH